MTQLLPFNQAKRAIFKKLEKVLVEHEDGTVTYTDGLTDVKMANLINKDLPEANINPGNIAGVRGRSWGILRKSVKLTAAQEIAELKEQVRILMENATVENNSQSFDEMMGEGG